MKTSKSNFSGIIALVIFSFIAVKKMLMIK
jgi:hypothetical protein